MIKLPKIDNQILLYGAAAIGAYLLYKQATKTASDVVDSILKIDPLGSLGAVAKDALGLPVIAPNPKAPVLTENFTAYLEQFGGVDNYLLQKKTGTFVGKPYDANVDYNSLNLTLWGVVTAPFRVGEKIGEWLNK